MNENLDEPCEIKIKNSITSTVFKKLFNPEIKEHIFIPNTNNCSFEIILRILKEYNSKYTNLSIYNIKDILILKYSELFKIYKTKLLDILSRQGKTRLIKRVKINEITLLDLIQSDAYFISSLDIWILALHYNIPLIMMNKVSLQETKYKTQIMTIAENKENYYYFLQQSSIDHSKSDTGKPMTYSLYSDKNNVFKISLDKVIDSTLVDKIKGHELEYKLDDFIKEFSLEEDRTANKKIVTKIDGAKTKL